MADYSDYYYTDCQQLYELCMAQDYQQLYELCMAQDYQQSL